MSHGVMVVLARRPPLHGTVSRYTGTSFYDPCHCDLCREAWRGYMARWRADHLRRARARAAEITRARFAETGGTREEMDIPGSGVNSAGTIYTGRRAS